MSKMVGANACVSKACSRSAREGEAALLILRVSTFCPAPPIWPPPGWRTWSHRRCTHKSSAEPADYRTLAGGLCYDEHCRTFSSAEMEHIDEKLNPSRSHRLESDRRHRSSRWVGIPD